MRFEIRKVITNVSIPNNACAVATKQAKDNLVSYILRAICSSGHGSLFPAGLSGESSAACLE